MNNDVYAINDIKFYMKYGLIIMLLIIICLQAILYKISSISKDRKRFKMVLVVLGAVFFTGNVFIIMILKYPVPILYRNTIMPAIYIPLIMTIITEHMKK